MKDEYIKNFYNEVNQELEGNYKIILEPGRKLTEDWIEYDPVKWEVEKPLQNLVDKLLKENTLSLEEKILSIYKFICLNYIYDDNVLYFFKRGYAYTYTLSNPSSNVMSTGFSGSGLPVRTKFKISAVVTA